MSRTNPYKKKRHSVNRTLLIYGEGLGEEVFLKHLRGLYSHNSGTGVKIRNGKGGTPINIVMCAVNDPGAFDRKVVILDNDKPEQEMSVARDKAKKEGIEIIENTPCLEATFLSILKPKQSFSDKTTAWCKREFESNYLNGKERMEINNYKNIFSKEVLDSQRLKVAVLNSILLLMEY